jgi:F-type H+-transporting ATPase subunit epsilon
MTLALLSPEKRVEDLHAGASIANVLIPGVDGYFVASPKHTDLIAEIGIGVLTLLGESAEVIQQYFVSGGFVEMADGNTLKVLADVIETPTEVQIERAQGAQERAMERLKTRAQNADVDLLDFDRANKALARARYRLDLKSQKK